MASTFTPTGVCRPELPEEEMPATQAERPTDAPLAASDQRTPRQLRPPALARPRRDPRDELVVPGDTGGLTRLGQLGCMTGPQLRFECFGGCKEQNFARRMKRLRTRGLVGVTRFLGMGTNLFWLTPRGADVLVDGGFAPADTLFPRTRAVAAKDLAHHLTIVDATLLALRGIPLTAAQIEPSWLFQRLNQPEPEAIPDLLLSTPGKAGRTHHLAYEIDLASETLKVFIPKLVKLGRVLTGRANGGTSAVVILTRGSGRASSIARAIDALAVPIDVPVLVRELPRGGALDREALAAVMSRGGESPGGAPSARSP